ncbi:MAG: hypothetical protein M3362_04975 [Acidobacteriota bacterium]|nr:hypothetical protein [Acidobacteriota bacterium]
MKRFIITVVLLLLCAASCVWAQTRQGRRTSRATGSTASDPPIIDIHQIDFRNYTFPLDGKYYKLIDGFYAETAVTGIQWRFAMVDGPYFGDLTGDRKDEVAFVFSYGNLNAPQTTEARVYTLRNGRAVLLAIFPLAKSVQCELDHYMHIDDGMLNVERVVEKGTACDHNEITQYRWNGSAFMPVGGVKRMPCRCM